MALDMGVGNFYSALRVISENDCFLHLLRARVAELADALDLGSSGQPWGFDSPLSHQLIMAITFPRHKDRKVGLLSPLADRDVIYAAG